MPRDVVVRINSDLGRVVKLADLQERLIKDGATPAGEMSPEQFAAHVKSEIIKWGKAVKDSGAKADL